MSKQLKHKLLNLKSTLMSTEYINEFGERIIILGDGPLNHHPHRQELNTNTGNGAILQLVANTNFDVDDANDYSTSTTNVPLSLNEPIAHGVKTYAVNIQGFIHHSDVTKFRYIKVEYTGRPNIRELREMFVDWFIHSYNVGTITYNDMSIFQCMRDHMKIYSNSDGNGGVVVYNLFSEMVFPNGFLRWIVLGGDCVPLCFNFKEIPGVEINSVTLTVTYKFLPQALRRLEIEHVGTHGRVSPKWQYFSTNAITVSLPEPSRITRHYLEATGNVHGMFVKSAAPIVSFKIMLNNQPYVHYTNAIDIQLNTVQFGDNGWFFVPFDLERKYEKLSDCFVADHNGGLELGRIDTMYIEINHSVPVSEVSYAFPAYMSLHRSIIIPELVCRNPRTEMMSGYNVYGLVFENHATPQIQGSLCNILSQAEPTPAETTENCVISHEPIETDAIYALCMTCTKPMLLNFVISWLKTPNADDKCPHCRSKWREIGTNIRVYKHT